MKRQLAILHLLIGGSLLLLFLFAFAVGAAETVSSAGEALLILAFVAAFPMVSLLGGIAMLRNRRSGEAMIKGLSVILIFLFPLGTLLGAFGLWVLIWDPHGDRRSEAKALGRTFE